MQIEASRLDRETMEADEAEAHRRGEIAKKTEALEEKKVRDGVASFNAMKDWDPAGT